MQVKGNQGNLLKECIALSSRETHTGKSKTVGKRERNRIEHRETTVYTVNDHDLGKAWKAIRTVLTVYRRVKTFDTLLKKWRERKETSYYISTSNRYTAKEFGNIIRSHWGIENSNHYVRDVTLKEDASRIRKNPIVMATLRSFALNLLRVNKETNISQAIYRNSLKLDRVLKYRGVR